MNTLPDEITRMIRAEVQRLPVIQRRIMYQQKPEEILELIGKLQQICNYKPVDKKSKLIQERKLAALYKQWLLYINSPISNPATSFIGPSNHTVLQGSLAEMKVYLSNKDIQDILCKMIRQTDFKKRSPMQHIRIFQNVMLDLNNHGLLKKKQIDDIILDIIKKKKANVCQYLYNEFNGWLENI